MARPSKKSVPRGEGNPALPTLLALSTLLLLYFLLGVGYSHGRVPLAESPDELDHFQYIQVLSQTGQLPIMSPIASENETMEANQPPLFYATQSLLLRLAGLEVGDRLDLPHNACYSFDPADRGRQTFYQHTTAELNPHTPPYTAFYAARLISLLMGAGVVLLTYAIGREVAPTEPTVALLAAGLVGLNPQFIFMMGSVNNDVLMALLGTAVLFLAIRGLHTPSVRLYATLGLLLGLGFLTKFALFAFWPLAVLSVLGGWWLQSQKPRPRQPALTYLALVLSLPPLVSGWLYVRNWRIYGDPLVWDVHLAAKGDQVLRTAPLALADLGQFVVVHFQSFWGLLGWLNVALLDWMYLVLALFVLVAVGGGITAVWQRPAWLRWPELILLTMGVGAIYASLLRYILTINWSGYQGRLAFAAIAGIGVLLAVGWVVLWAKINQRWRRWLYFLPLLFLLGVNGWLWGWGLGAAYPTAVYADHLPPMTPLCIRSAPHFIVEGVDLPREWAEGQPATVQLAIWSMSGQGAMPAQLNLQLMDGTLIAQQSFMLKWQTSDSQPLAVQTVTLTPTIALPHPAQLFLTLTIPDQELTTATRRVLDQPVVLADGRLAPSAPIPADFTHEAGVTFGDKMTLLGYTLLPVEDEDAVRVRLYWQAAQPLAEVYTTFVHVTATDDSTAVLLSQQDSPPLNGLYPTTLWQVGELVVEEKTIPFPPEATTLWVGVYGAEGNLLLPDGDVRWPLPSSPTQP